MSDSYELTDVDSFTPMAMGIPGARTFFLLVARDATQISFKCEKQHVEALANALSSLLGDVESTAEPIASQHPSQTFASPAPAWTVGSIALGMDESEGRIFVVLEEVTNDEDSGASARFGMTVAQAQRFVVQGTELVAAGRPGCVLCGSPIDVLGYRCACFN